MKHSFPGKLLTVIFLVSGTYFIASIFLSGNKFYVFDALWRLLIILGVLLVGKYNPSLSGKQLSALILFFIIEGICYLVFYPLFPPIRIFLSVLLAPLAEELLFRGWAMEQIKGSAKQKIWISSLFFSLYHMKNAYVLTLPALVYQLCYAGIFIGPIFAWLRIRYGSIFPALLVHSGNNSVADIVTTKLFPILLRRNRGF